MADEQRERVLVRYSGDIGTKARATRSQFLSRLTRNLRDALASEGAAARVRLAHDRLFAEDPGERGLDAMARVFGVQSIARIEASVPPSLEDVVRRGEELFRERVRGRRFAVRARRVGNRSRIPLSSKDVAHELGAALLPVSAGVDLSSPEITVQIEIHEKKAHLFAGTRAGPGGLPVGVEGRALALVSGGFDSAVAAWYLLKRGVALDYLFLNLGGEAHQQGVLRVAKIVADRWSYGDRPRFHAVDFEPVARAIQQQTERRYAQVLLKRMMLRAAERVAAIHGCEALVTGDAIGQVSSQTLTNLAVISGASALPVLRPLVGFNKDEILDVARRIGTYDLSKVVGEYCALVPSKPATAAALERVEAQEAKLDPSLVARAVSESPEFDLRDLEVEKLDVPDVTVDRVPEGAMVVDLRTREEFEEWHYPGAVRMDFAEAARVYGSFDRSQPYLFCCEIALKSAHLAEIMRRDGFEAFHFRGGTRALRRSCGG